MCGFVGEGRAVEALQETVRLQFGEQPCRLIFDVFGKAKRVATLEHAYGTWLAGPRVDILKQVMVDGFVMCEIEISFGQRLVGPRARYFGLERVQFSLPAQVELVYQDGRILVSV